MPPRSKSIFRQPGAQHFQLVHRSQRDPLRADPGASTHVFKGFEPGNAARKGKSRAELEGILGDDALHERANVGEAALYDIFFDDTAYDYMQHLRPIGDAPASDELGTVDSVLLEAPAGAQGPTLSKAQGKRRARERDLQLRLPEEVLPSGRMRSQKEAQDALLGVPLALAGFQPDMDPHLRQTLEALEDDAFVVDDDGPGEGGEEDPEDFFGELLGAGEVGDEREREDFVFEEWGVDDDGRPGRGGAQEGEDGEVDDLTARVKAFKLSQSRAAGGADGGSEEEGDGEGAADEEEWVDEPAVSDSELSAIRARLAAFQLSHKPPSAASSAAAADDLGSEAGSTLPPLPVIGGKRRRPGAYSDASGFSMSSSSVWRSAGQKMVDDRFDEVEKAYEDDDDEDDDDDDDDGEGGGDAGEAPDLIASRADFQSVIDGFMQQYEQVGNTVRPASETLDTLRRVLGSGARVGRNGAGAGNGDDDNDDDILMPVDVDEVKDTWDVETILSTYSNLENHPRVISARGVLGRGVKRIRLDTRTGMPTVEEEGNEPGAKRSRRLERERERDALMEDKPQSGPPKITIARPREESAAEKKVRKAAVKQERQARRAEKKATTTAFSVERKSQLKHTPINTVSAVAVKL